MTFEGSFVVDGFARFLKTLAREMARDGITVNTVATGRFATDRMAELGGSIEQVEAAARAEVPAGRLGEPRHDTHAMLTNRHPGNLTEGQRPQDLGVVET